MHQRIMNENPRWTVWHIAMPEAKTWKFTLWNTQRWDEYFKEKGIIIQGDRSFLTYEHSGAYTEWLLAHDPVPEHWKTI